MPSSPITCHVLNTLSGTPAADINSVLTLLDPDPSKLAMCSSDNTFYAATNEDGRVNEWKSSAKTSLEDVMNKFSDGEKTTWSIKFDIGTWYEARNVDCFWPEIEVKFYVRKGSKHYHVPLLVGPWTYTTYRGS